MTETFKFKKFRIICGKIGKKGHKLKTNVKNGFLRTLKPIFLYITYQNRKNEDISSREWWNRVKRSLLNEKGENEFCVLINLYFGISNVRIQQTRIFTSTDTVG